LNIEHVSKVDVSKVDRQELFGRCKINEKKTQDVGKRKGRAYAALLFGREMYGWTGKILKVDLTRGRVWREDFPQELLHSYLGGRGLGMRLLRDRFRLDPFDPEMPLIFAVGPLCGTAAPATARLTVVTRSPLTGTVCDSSVGGHFAWRLKAAGVDTLCIVGESKRPVLLSISGEDAELLPADDLWGRNIPETVRFLSPLGSVAVIGPAGERGVLFAGIMIGEGNLSGRGGAGAVMGRKRLKAVVVDGNGSTVIADQVRLNNAGQDVLRLFRASPVICGELGIAEFGTPALVDLTRQRRMTPSENFRKTVFEGSAVYNGPAIRRAYMTVNSGCHDCPIRCRKNTPAGENLPEYETLSHFGALNGIANLTAIINANTVCNELGLDPISTAATIAAWGEWRGRFADADELPDLLAEIALRRGDGELLALGSRRMAEALGNPGLSMSVKSLELPAYDPRGGYGLALAFCTSNHGACHLPAYSVAHEILRKPVATDRFSFSGKARIIKIAEDVNASADSLVACRFAFLGASLEEYAEILTAVTGLEYTPELLNKIGERICLTERFYNCVNGFNADDDHLPERFYTEPGSSGEGIDIPPIDRELFDAELQKYYRMRGLTLAGTFADEDFLERQP
jgi:aldehyde:ferredoxin oxidoreductase